MPKPALGSVKVGDRLILIPAPNKWNPKPNVDVAVVKVGRVWVELQQVSEGVTHGQTWRMRLDSQDAGSSYSARDRFVTAEQLTWERRLSEARRVLFDAGITFNSTQGRQWRTDEDRLFALAAFVAAYDADHPTFPAA